MPLSGSKGASVKTHWLVAVIASKQIATARLILFDEFGMVEVVENADPFEYVNACC